MQVRRNAHIEILPLSTGCLGACTYCKTKHARGQLGSYELQALVERAASAASEPLVRFCSQTWVTGRTLFNPSAASAGLSSNMRAEGAVAETVLQPSLPLLAGAWTSSRAPVPFCR